MAGRLTDLLAQLFELKWRDVPVPCIDFRTEIVHDQVQHEWPDRDGAHVEATGRKALVHRATIPFFANMSPGLSETWNTGGAVLYPTVFRNFHIAFTTRTSGPLQHPEFGLIQCKPGHATEHWAAKRRDGCLVEASWIESLDDTISDFQDILARKSPVPLAYVASGDLDAQLGEYDNPSLDPGDTTSFTDDIVAVTSAVDAATLVSSSAAGKINAVIYRVQSLQDRVIALNDSTAWPILTSCDRLKGALFDMRTGLLTGGKAILYYRTPVDTTLPALVVPTRSNIVDLLTLNPRLAAGPVVPANTVVRYYKLAV
jgi:hypothetical protein